MATTDQIAALIGAHYQGDETRFKAVVGQISAHARAHKQEAVARAVEYAASTRPRIVALAPETKSAFRSILDQTTLGDLVLTQQQRETVESVIAEQRARETLRAHGFKPAQRLLLTGPPGTGKTSTAVAMGVELGLPMLAIRLESIVDSHLGVTAQKLRAVLDVVLQQRAVYLFDEFDWLGMRRRATNDAGSDELRRTLNMFLQFLEEPNENDSVIIAATNMGEHLDRALLRRFDVHISYELSHDTTVAMVSLCVKQLARHSLTAAPGFDQAALVERFAPHSPAELVRAFAAASKGAVLKNAKQITHAEVLARAPAPVAEPSR